MDKVVNETCCSCCCHSSVCKLKGQLLSIQSKVNELFHESTRSIDSELSYFICPRISCIAYKQTDNQVPKSGGAWWADDKIVLTSTENGPEDSGFGRVIKSDYAPPVY